MRFAIPSGPVALSGCRVRKFSRNSAQVNGAFRSSSGGSESATCGAETLAANQLSRRELQEQQTVQPLKFVPSAGPCSGAIKSVSATHTDKSATIGELQGGDNCHEAHLLPSRTLSRTRKRPPPLMALDLDGESDVEPKTNVQPVPLKGFCVEKVLA